MKIIVTIDGNIPSRFAHSFNVMKMTQGFMQAGHEVEVVSLLSWPLIKNWLEIRNIYKHYGITRDVNITLLPVFNREFFSKTIAAKDFNSRFISYFIKSRPDVVYCRSYISIVECIKSELPCIIETHTTNYDNPDLGEVYRLSHSMYFKGLVTINDILKKEYILRGVPEKKIIVEEDGVDMSRFNINDDKLFWRKKLKLPEDKNIVVYSGSLHKEKGILSIIETANILKSENIKFYLIGGDDEQVTYWNQYLKERGVDNVSFLGFKANSELPYYFKASDVLFMPYEKDIKYSVMDINTTSPLKLFEYMAAKRPIVSSKLPVIEKIVTNEESAMLAQPGDIQNLAQILKEIINRPEKYNLLSENAYNLSFQYDWKERCKRILDKVDMK